MPEKENDNSFPLQGKNYLLLASATLICIVGFLLMAGGSDGDPEKFNGEELFSFRRITLAPIVILFGYAMVMVAILKKPKGEEEKDSDKDSIESGSEE
ncbi:MAG: DUF3098 domain-containing protein [Flavobacteriales bacterium]